MISVSYIFNIKEKDKGNKESNTTLHGHYPAATLATTLG